MNGERKRSSVKFKIDKWSIFFEPERKLVKQTREHGQRTGGVLILCFSADEKVSKAMESHH